MAELESQHAEELLKKEGEIDILQQEYETQIAKKLSSEAVHAQKKLKNRQSGKKNNKKNGNN